MPPANLLFSLYEGRKRGSEAEPIRVQSLNFVLDLNSTSARGERGFARALRAPLWERASIASQHASNRTRRGVVERPRGGLVSVEQLQHQQQQRPSAICVDPMWGLLRRARRQPLQQRAHTARHRGRPSARPLRADLPERHGTSRQRPHRRHAGSLCPRGQERGLYWCRPPRSLQHHRNIACRGCVQRGFPVPERRLLPEPGAGRGGRLRLVRHMPADRRGRPALHRRVSPRGHVRSFDGDADVRAGGARGRGGEVRRAGPACGAGCIAPARGRAPSYPQRASLARRTASAQPRQTAWGRRASHPERRAPPARSTSPARQGWVAARRARRAAPSRGPAPVRHAVIGAMSRRRLQRHLSDGDRRWPRVQGRRHVEHLRHLRAVPGRHVRAAGQPGLQIGTARFARRRGQLANARRAFVGLGHRRALRSLFCRAVVFLHNTRA